MKDNKKNPAPIAPVSADASNASGLKFTVPSAKPEKGTLVKNTGNAKGGTDPYKQAKPSRKFVTNTGGARYGVRVKFQKTVAPEAGSTQSNGRIFKASVNRSGFDGGANEINV